MKNLALLILMILMFTVVDFPAQTMNLKSQNKSIKVSLSSKSRAWKKDSEMPVILHITNLSSGNKNLKIHSIRFHLSPLGENYWQTYIVPNSAHKEVFWKIKKGETLEQNYDLSKLTFLNFSGKTSQENKFVKEKYRVTLLLQIYENEHLISYESSIFIRLQ